MGGDWKEMILAAQEGNLNLVKYHIRNGIDPNYQHPEFLTSALLESIRFKQLEVAKFLLENGADPNIVEIFDSSTPLFIAKQNKDQAAINLLTAYGAKPQKNLNVQRLFGNSKRGWLDWLLGIK